MGVFQEVKLVWMGQERTIPPDQLLMCIAQIEGVLTLGELMAYSASSNIPLGRVSMAFAIALRAAGFRITDAEVYDKLFANAGDGMQELAVSMVLALHHLMVPPAHMRAAEEKVRAGAASGKLEGGSPSAAPSSSVTS